jgi:pyruvate/2-oxoglutarate dehydrogenase complex dihydrolipoamide dehydrogenase (E3) component
VLGANSAGVEFAQIFARFGCKVTLFDPSLEFLPQVDRDAAEILKQVLTCEGVKFAFGNEIKVEKTANAKKVTGEDFEQILIMPERVPNVESLNLDAVHVIHDEHGIWVTDALRTTNRRILAVGDVCSPHHSTHAARAMAREVVPNALFFRSHSTSRLQIPSCIYTDPQIAHVGATSDDPRFSKWKTITIPFSELDRAVIDGEEDGLIKLHHDLRGHIHSATIVSSHASELIGQLLIAMHNKIKLWTLADTVFPYPSLSEAFRRAGDKYRHSLLTPAVEGLLKKIVQWRR